MKRFVLIFIMAGLLSACSSTADKSAAEDDKDTSAAYQELLALQPGLEGIPEEVLTKAEAFISQLEEKSDIIFYNSGEYWQAIDTDAGNVYNLMYFAQSYHGKKIPGDQLMQVRVMIDNTTYQINGICILHPDKERFLEQQSSTVIEEYEEVYYNYLWPAFENTDFYTLFDKRPYKRLEGSDDDHHSEHKLYTEYVVDFMAIYQNAS